MTDEHTSEEGLNDLLDQLTDDILELTEEELRAEMAADGESMDQHSMAFQQALSGARARLRGRQPIGGFLPTFTLPFSPETLSRFPSVERSVDGFGEGRRLSKPLLHYRGSIEELMALLPEFEKAPFTADPAMPPHPDLRLVVSKPDGRWAEMAVGAVSETYALVQHREAAAICLRGLESLHLPREELTGELSLSEFGEWMAFTFVLPLEHAFVDMHGHGLDFRCVVANSVDRSSPLQYWFDWFREVCSNGMVVPEFRGISQRTLHRSGLSLPEIEESVYRGLGIALPAGVRFQRLLERWQRSRLSGRGLEEWANESLREKWGLHAAARVYRICVSGSDTEFDIGESGIPTQLAWRHPPTARVPGSPEAAETVYDVAQAMSWVASRQQDVDQRLRRQGQIPALLDHLHAA